MVEMAEDPAAASGDIVDEDIASRGVAVGSVALLESSDGKVNFSKFRNGFFLIDDVRSGSPKSRRMEQISKRTCSTTMVL